MNKAELVSFIAETAEISKAKAVAALDAFTTKVIAEVKTGNNVTLVGFGTFSRVTRKARTGRNPQNGQSIKIATKHVAKFKPGKTFSDTVKGGKVAKAGKSAK